MIWDKAAPFYDLFEDLYNSQVNARLCETVASYIDEGDYVLECACGTGMLSFPITAKCDKLLATDYSVGMLKQSMRKCLRLRQENIRFARASVLELPYADGAFDKVVAANVIHLLSDPAKALRELERVCKVGGEMIIPTYINVGTRSASAAARWLEKLGVSFKRQFTYEGYRDFFASLGYAGVEYMLIEGRMPCAIAVIEKR